MAKAGKLVSADSLRRDGTRKYPISIETYMPYLVNRVAIAAVKGAAGEFANRSLTVAKYRILLAASQHKDVHFRELANLTSIEPPTLSRFLDEMEDAKLLRRQQDKNDARLVSISVTTAGHALLKNSMAWAVEVETDMLKGIDKAEAELLRAHLNRMYLNLCARAARLKS